MSTTYPLAKPIETSIDVIWSIAGPAVSACSLRACLDCGRPFECVTDKGRRHCIPCFAKLMRKRRTTCSACGRECYGERCRSCLAEERAARKPKPKAPRYCRECGTAVPSKRSWCDSCATERGRVAARNHYRLRHGIAPDEPLRRTGRPRKSA